jgi:hypothetical protein
VDADESLRLTSTPFLANVLGEAFTAGLFMPTVCDPGVFGAGVIAFF